MDWIRLPSWSQTKVSMVWKAILHTLPFIREGLAWRINNGTSARIGMDPWTGGGNIYKLPPSLILFLNQRHIKVIAQIVDLENSAIFEQAWLSAPHLGIPEHWLQTWEGYINALKEAHVRIKEGLDELILTPTDHGMYSPKIGYPILLIARKPHALLDWWSKLWKLKAPPRTKLFMWNMLSNKTPTGATLCINLTAMGIGVYYVNRPRRQMITCFSIA